MYAYHETSYQDKGEWRVGLSILEKVGEKWYTVFQKGRGPWVRIDVSWGTAIFNNILETDEVMTGEELFERFPELAMLMME